MRIRLRQLLAKTAERRAERDLAIANEWFCVDRAEWPEHGGGSDHPASGVRRGEDRRRV